MPWVLVSWEDFREYVGNYLSPFYHMTSLKIPGNQFMQSREKTPVVPTIQGDISILAHCIISVQYSDNPQKNPLAINTKIAKINKHEASESPTFSH